MCTLNEIAGLGGVMIGDGEVLEMVVELLAEGAGDGFTGESRPAAFEVGEHAAEGGDQSDESAGNPERAGIGRFR